MNDNTPVTLEGLVWQESFRNWVLHPTPERNQFWQGWLTRNPALTDTVAQAREVVLALQVKNRPITESDIQAIIELTRQYLDLPAKPKVRPIYSNFNWQMAAAVSLLMLAGAGFWWKNQRPSTAPQSTVATVQPQSNPALIHFKGTFLQLADGSQVRLQPGSELSYPARFTADRREVYLTGEATFDVQRRPGQPFLVHANGSVTRVLGTRFTVKASSETGQVVVKVLSGKVSVLPETEWVRSQQEKAYQPHTIIVTPNQQVVFERSTERMSKSVVEVPLVVQTPGSVPSFNFVNAPLPVVFHTLEQAYGIPIVFDAELMRNCLVTAPLAEEPLFDKLTIICETIGARYEVLDAQIIITGKGCSM